MKTSKQIYEATAIELNKFQAPTLKLYEFNYFVNQAINLFVNKVYNIYDVNQQTTDDLRVLKATATLKPELATSTGNKAIDYFRGATYFVNMPDDYLHLLNCICLFDVKKLKECWDEGDVMVVGATKLTADSWSSIVDDVYNRPTKKRPYYYIHNQNDIYVDDTTKIPTDRNSLLPTNVNSTGATVASNNATDVLETVNTSTTPPTFTGFDRKFDFDLDYDGTIAPGEQLDAIEKPAGSRHANSSRVKVEIRCGRDKLNIFDLAAVLIEYIKAPQYIELTQEQLDSNKDISQILEFPDYVIQEIINELVNLIMRKTNDASLQTHMLITLSIARPTGQLQ